MAGKAPGPKGPKPQAVRDWFEQEAPTGPAIVRLGRRLLERGRASWTVWVAAALFVSGVWTVVKVKRPAPYEVTVVVRVAEGKVTRPGSTLGRGTLRAYVNEVAMTNPRLVELMSKHPASFRRVKSDPVFAVQDFRENLHIDISEDDFVEDRAPNDPPRSARLLITFKGADPTVTWQVTQELADLIAGSSMAVQRAAMERELQGANASVASAVQATNEIEAQRTVGPNSALAVARARLLAAQQRVQDARLALRALGQQQELRFELVDRGRVPRPLNPVKVGVKTFAITSLLALLAGWLLAGAFDPRVLDESDVTDLGMPILGRFRALPQSGDPEQPADTSRAPDSRV